MAELSLVFVSSVVAKQETLHKPKIKLRYNTRCYFNVHSKTKLSQLNLLHGTKN